MPGFSSTGLGDITHNRIGSTGAYLADLLYFLFGRPAYLLPLALGGERRYGWVGAAPRLKSASRANLIVRALGFAVLLTCSCALTALHWSPGVLRQSAGGVVGMAVGQRPGCRPQPAGRDAAAAGGLGGQCGRSLRHLLAARDRRARRCGLARHSLHARAPAGDARSERRAGAQAGAHGGRRGRDQEDPRPAAAAHRGAGARCAQE